VYVRGAEGREAATICAAVADALRFLDSCGLRTSEPAELRIVDRLPDPADTRAFGCHVKSERRIYMLTLSACGRLVSDLPLDEPVYRGLIAHEVGHRVASANFMLRKPTVVGHEYIAYVTMFSTMPPETRDRILNLFPGEGFDSEREIGLSTYLVSPNRFGAQAYRHFVRPENRAAFLQRILSGDALAVEDPP
jgi:hypothetical protein